MPSKPDFHTFMSCPAAANCGVIVAQKVFVAPTQFAAKQPISFTSNGRPGVRLADVMASSARIDRSTTVPDLSETAKKITMRINWPGYEPWHQIIHIFDHTYNANPITIGKLAQEVAKGINVLIRDYASLPCSEPGWALGNHTLEQLTLVEFRHVSTGSWQPVLCLNVNH